MDYKVSVIIPVYNAQEYLNECVESLLSQTLNSIEIIMIDDGSSDDSGKICDDYANRYENIIVKHIENSGPSHARNIGIEIANGEYIGFVDSDDYVSKDMFQMLYSKALENQFDITMCSYCVDTEGSIVDVHMQYKDCYIGQEEIKNGLISLYSKPVHTGLFSSCNKIFNKKLLYNNNLKFDEALIRAEDAWLVFEALKCANKVGFIDEALYFYRQVASSTMHSIQPDRYEKSKFFRKKLLKELDLLNISFNSDELYCEFLYENFVMFRQLFADNRKSEILDILGDNFFFEACKYRRLLPNHLKVLCVFERLRMKKTLLFLLSFWR